MNIPFTKMHGLGNDFMVIDNTKQTICLDKMQISSLADRHTGIGFDQCLIIEAPLDSSHDFFYRIFNANGEEVGQCGNGARCLALYVKKYGLTEKNIIRVNTKTTTMTLQINPDDTVSVNMGTPVLQPEHIPFIAAQQADSYSLSLEESRAITIHAVSVGNPHAVMLVQDLKNTPVSILGKAISTHERFPAQVNAGFMQIVSPHHIQLRVYERGCGETLACGSGAVAAAAIGRLFHHLDENIRVSLPGGDLTISWPSLEKGLIVTGPGTFVYEGVVFNS